MHVGVDALLDLGLSSDFGNPPPEGLESCTDLDLLALWIADELLDPVVVEGQNYLIGPLLEALVFDDVVVLLRGLKVLRRLVLALDRRDVVVEGLVYDPVDSGPLNGGVANTLNVQLFFVSPLHFAPFRLLLGRNARNGVWLEPRLRDKRPVLNDDAVFVLKLLGVVVEEGLVSLELLANGRQRKAV